MTVAGTRFDVGWGSKLRAGVEAVEGRSSALGIVALLAVLALSFQGSRGLWEPDEGRYAAIAAQMLRSGDWLVPRLNGEPYLDKPPLLYWSLAGGMALGGRNEWGARLPLAFLFLAQAVALAGIGRALWDRKTGWLAAGIWGTSLLPFLAANMVTPDLALACFSAFTWLGVVRAAGASTPAQRWRWWLVAGLAAGLAMLTKGPALLVSLPPVLFYLAGSGRLRAALRAPQAWIGVLLALGIAAAWYVPILRTIPESASYMMDNQVTGRLLTSSYQRNPGVTGAVATYLPTLLLGALPWWPIAAAGTLGTSSWRNATWRRLVGARKNPVDWLLLSGVLFPLALFMAASSRLPLYILPIWTPLALVLARRLENTHMLSRRLLKPLAAWVLFLVAIKAGAAYLPVGARDSRRLANSLASTHSPGSTSLVVISAQANGLSFYGFTHFRWVREGRTSYPLFKPPALLEEALPEIARENIPHLMLMDARRSAGLLLRLRDAGWSCSAPVRYERLVGAECSPLRDDAIRSEDGPASVRPAVNGSIPARPPDRGR